MGKQAKGQAKPNNDRTVPRDPCPACEHWELALARQPFYDCAVCGKHYDQKDLQRKP